MKVYELIAKLAEQPLNSDIKVIVLDDVLRDPMPEQIWNDIDENFLLVI